MKYLHFILLLAAFAIGLPRGLEAQTLREYQKAADKMVAAGDSVGALGIYRQAFDEVDRVLDAEARYQMAEIAEGLRYYTIAKQQYDFIASSDQAENYPTIRLKLADAQRKTGSYEAAKSNYLKIISTAKDSFSIKSAQKGLADAEWALSRVTRMDSVEVVKLPAVVNTNSSEFAGFVSNDKLYFSRLELRDYKNKEAGTQTSVLVTDVEGLDSIAFNVPLFPGQYVAHFAITDSKDEVYFTVCENIDIADYRCDIYVTGFSESGPKGDAKKLESPINLPAYTQTNPTIGTDPLSGDKLLIFASDRPGGEGKMDLWMSRIGKDGRASTPENLGFANTQEDDVTPFFHTGTQALFFSSKGHETLGGFDINRVRYDNGNWGEVEGLKAPINSTFDDTYYALVSNPARTYFSSNRPGTTCEAKEIQECCGFDLYSVNIAIELEVLTFDKLDSTALSETTVILYDLESGEEIMRFTEASNLANFPIQLGRSYRLIASREEYANDTLDFDTKNIYQPTLITKKMYLPPMISLELYTYNSIDNTPLNGVNIEWTELGGRDTIKRSERVISKYLFSIEYGKTYRAFGSRAGYSPDTEIIATSTFNGPGRIIRDTLFLAPFSPLPLVLYFDNDQPNPRSTEPTTTLTYSETVPGYLNREPVFLANASKGVEDSRNEIERFFDEVKENNQKLLEFSTTLVKYLSEGNEIDIIIEGYASPLAQNDYNTTLTSRRTRSIINQFIQWESGALLPYLKTGQLRIRQEPLGERQSPAGISDNPQNRTRSEFGLKASRQRKVRIIDIQRRVELPLSQTPLLNSNESQNTTR